MTKLAKILVWAALSLPIVSAAQSGTFTTYTTTWNGATRQYSIYMPPILQSPLSMVVCLHATVKAPSNAPPLTYCQDTESWERYSDRYGFLVVMPVSTWNSNNGGQWYWNAYNLSPLFPVPPDDSGFIRSVVQTVASKFSTDSKHVFVVGMSSGAFMAHRVAMDSSDLVAAIAPVSGMVWADTSTLPTPAYPVSVLEYHGDKDSIVNYCGGYIWAWGPKIAQASIDNSINYWLQSDGLGTNSTPLCVNNAPSGVYSLDFKGTVEVVFIREVAYGHTYDSSLTQAIWEFFATHPKN